MQFVFSTAETDRSNEWELNFTAKTKELYFLEIFYAIVWKEIPEGKTVNDHEFLSLKRIVLLKKKVKRNLFCAEGPCDLN